MSTQIFISWSGEFSHKVASLLHDWIPTVLQSAEPFLSSTDIEKGSRWSDHVAKKLEECGFGIIVLTKINLTAPWILFEAGALSKMVGQGQVSSLLIGVDVVDVKLPLSQFQNTKFDKADVLKLLSLINRASQNPLREDVLGRAFNALWPDFENAVRSALDEEAASDEESQPADLVSDNDSIKTSVGELIQSVQLLRDDFRRSSSRSGLSHDIISDLKQEIRRTVGLPTGLLLDLEYVRSKLDEGRDALEIKVYLKVMLLSILQNVLIVRQSLSGLGYYAVDHITT